MNFIIVESRTAIVAVGALIVGAGGGSIVEVVGSARAGADSIEAGGGVTKIQSSSSTSLGRLARRNVTCLAIAVQEL